MNQSSEEQERELDKLQAQMAKDEAEALASRLIVIRVSERCCIVALRTATTFAARTVFTAKKVYGPATKEDCLKFCCDVNNGVIDKNDL